MNKKEYLKLVRTNFPAITFQKARLITKGLDDDVLILDDKIAFAFPKKKLDCLEKFQREVKCLAILNQYVKTAIPNFKYFEKSLLFGGYEYVDGQPISKKLLEALTKTERTTLAKQIARFLNELHSVPVSKFKRIETPTIVAGDELNNHYKKLLKKLTGKIPQPTIDKFYKELVSSKQLLKWKKTIVHSDLTPEHVLYNFDRKKLAGIIDFGDVQIGDPAIDFCGFWEFGEDFINQIFASYITTDKQLKQRSLVWRTLRQIDTLHYEKVL